MEYWLSGPVENIPPLLQPVAHALLQSRDEVKESIKDLFIGFLLTDIQGYPLLKSYDLQEFSNTTRNAGTFTSRFEFPTQSFSPGKYILKINIMIHRVRWIVKEKQICIFEIPYVTRINDVNIDGLLNKIGKWKID